MNATITAHDTKFANRKARVLCKPKKPSPEVAPVILWLVLKQSAAVTGRNSTDPPCGFTRAGQAMTSCRLQCNHSSMTVTDNRRRRRRMPESITSLLLTLCVGGPAITFTCSFRLFHVACRTGLPNFVFTFSLKRTRDFELWLVTLTYELYLRRGTKMNHHTEYRGQRSFRSKVIVQTQAHGGPTAITVHKLVGNNAGVFDHYINA